MILVNHMGYIVRTQKPTEGTGLKNPTTLGANQMAKVTYRGVRQEKELTSLK